MTGHPTPYWRLSGFYFFFFAVLGGLVPYWAPYLKSLGFDAAQIGQMIAVLHGTKIVAPNIWGWIADHTGRTMRVVRAASLLALVCFAVVFLGHGYWLLLSAMAGFSFFWNAALPQFEANTMNHLGAEDHRYSHIRLWGSIGFIAAVTALGWMIDLHGHGVLPGALILLFGGLWIASLLAPERRASAHVDAQPGFLSILRRPRVAAFFVACFLLQASHGPYYAFFSIYLEDHGYGSDVIGVLWALGVVAEIGVFLVMHRLLGRFSPRILMTAALLLAALRWWLIGAYVDSPVLLVLAQMLHAATFGVYHAVGMFMINRFFVGRNQGRGQALYSSLTFGAGVAAGSLASGYLWTVVGGSATFFAAAALAFVAAAVAFRSLPPISGAAWRKNLWE